MNNRVFNDVHLAAEQVTETHRTLNADHTVTEEELPGLINLYVVIDGGKILIDQLKAPVVLEAIANQAPPEPEPAPAAEQS